MKEFFNKNKKFVLCVGIVVILLGVIVAGVFMMNMKSNPLKLSATEHTIEYGTPISLNAKDYLSHEAKEEVTDNTEVHIDGDKEEGKEYYPVGEYKVSLEYKGKETVVSVKVIDATKPELIVPKEVEILKGTELDKYDFKSLLETKDLSSLDEYEIDTSKVEANKEGEYEVVVSIKDKWGNKTEKNMKVKVIPEIKEDEKATTEVVEQEDGSKKVVVKKEPKPSNNTTSNSTNTSKPTTKPSNNGNASSSNGTSTKPSTEKPSSGSNGNTTSKPSTPPSKPTPERCTNNNNHDAMGVGNSGKWFNSKADAIAYYDSKLLYWSELWQSDKIGMEEYAKNCPSGYEIWDCLYCPKWTINFYYR